METHFSNRSLPESAEAFPPQVSSIAFLISRSGLLLAPSMPFPALIAAKSAPSMPADPDAQKCAALMALNLEAAPGGPAIITSARLVEVPASGLEPPFFHPSGYASGAGAQVASKIKEYCDVTGYVAPQNKFGLTEFDALTALENWVEKGQAPEKLSASRSANGIGERP